MSSLNTNIEPFPCLLRAEYLYNLESHHGEYVDCVVFAACAIPGRALMFHALLDNGAQIGRLPCSAFCWRECDPLPLHELELWNNFSHELSYIQYDYLYRLLVHTPIAGEDRRGRYMFTIDYYGTEMAENPGPEGWKCAHVISLDSGHLCVQPNNRIRWSEPGFVTNPFTVKPDYLINTHVWDAENVDRRTDPTSRYFYGTSGEGEESDEDPGHKPAGERPEGNEPVSDSGGVSLSCGIRRGWRPPL